MRTGKPAPRARPRTGRPGRRHAGLALTIRLALTAQNATRSQTVPSARHFRKWALAALRGDARITVRLVGPDEGRALNHDYRGKDYATNVLTFVLDDGPPGKRSSAGTARSHYAGDLALCAPVVAKEAREQKKDLMAHYAHLTVHGVLHLQGYEHEREREAVEMEKLETRILKRLGFPDPYVTAVSTSPTANHGRHAQ